MPTTGERRSLAGSSRSSSPEPPEIGPDVSGRAQLADWLTSDRNPLTSRVAVNRIWQHLFGQGLVGTPDDFGTRGERPSNPELLDHLARLFMRQGWSVKRLIRHLVLSRTYQLSSNFDRAAAARDPENRWLWRMNRRRLQAEALRDGLLAVSGQLDPSPAESVVADLNVQATGVGVKPNKPVRSVRRTVYLPVIRNDLPALFQLFDFGDSLSVNGRRSTTNVAPQALFMMNSPLVLEAATRTAASVLAGRDAPDERQVLERLYLRILGRPPRADEIEPSLALVHAALSESAGSEPAAPDRRSRRRRESGRGRSSATRCSVRRASSISIEEGRMFGSQPIGISRRALLKDAACGFGYLAFAGLASQAAAAERNPLAAKPPHFAARAKRVIFLFMHGGPSQVDTFDYKPTLREVLGQAGPLREASAADGPRKKKTPLLRESPWKFAQHGQSGRWVSELFPHVARHVDDLCVINSMHTEGRAHGRRPCGCTPGPPASSGRRSGRGSPTAWGPRTATCPASSPSAPPRAHGGVQNYSSAFLPAVYQGTAIGTADVPVKDASIPFLANDELSPAMQRRQLDLLQQLNRSHLATVRGRRPARRDGPVVRAGLPHAVGGALGARPGPGVGGDAEAVRHRRPRRPTTSAGSACWPAGSPRPACGSSRSPRATSGTSTRS